MTHKPTARGQLLHVLHLQWFTRSSKPYCAPCPLRGHAKKMQHVSAAIQDKHSCEMLVVPSALASTSCAPVVEVFQDFKLCLSRDGKFRVVEKLALLFCCPRRANVKQRRQLKTPLHNTRNPKKPFASCARPSRRAHTTLRTAGHAQG